MPYDPNDPRSQLTSSPGRGATATATATATLPTAEPEYHALGDGAPHEVSAAGSPSWYVRSQTSCFVYTDAVAGEVLSRRDQPDEYVVLLVSTPDKQAAAVTVSWNGGVAQAIDDAVVVVPPGDSDVTVDRAGVVIRIFSCEATDLLARCPNNARHTEQHGPTAPFTPWPAPPGGDHIRIYRIADAPVDPKRFGTIYRCRTVMVNVIPPIDGPRDPSKLSPHHHDDFEQLSLQVDGDYVHHIRTPWTTDMAEWREDHHQRCASPALTIIPPPTVHTSQAVGPGRHHLIDIFCPPRVDFSLRPGWVLNADDYPLLPEGVSAT